MLYKDMIEYYEYEEYKNSKIMRNLQVLKSGS